MCRTRSSLQVKYNVSEAEEADLPLSDVRLFTSAFFRAGADLLVPSGGHVMVNGLHMLRGGRPLEAMAAAQTSTLKRLVISLFGKYFVKEEEYRESFFRARVLAVMLHCGVPLSRVCLVGGVQDLSSAERAVALDGFGAVQLGRVLLADPDWCIKQRVHLQDDSVNKPTRADGCATIGSSSVSSVPLRVCDRSNDCIVGATMALTPLRCHKYTSDDW
jgi:hypothetical protein